nr:MAG TPA: hypothetical protein [Siphoviridae sp. ctBWu8]DAK97046.1 MAG TPA: hypothetical protein [Caudoviricetes sp.]
MHILTIVSTVPILLPSSIDLYISKDIFIDSEASLWLLNFFFLHSLKYSKFIIITLSIFIMHILCIFISIY